MFKFCSECGLKSTNKSKFCAECGFRLDTDDLPTPPKPAVAAPNPSPSKPTVASHGSKSQINVPPAATGEEAKFLYSQCVETIRNAKGGNNDSGVKAFKRHCKAYGTGEIDPATFHAFLVEEVGQGILASFLPGLVKLIPDEHKRSELLAYDASMSGGSTAFSKSYDGTGFTLLYLPLKKLTRQYSLL
jgi:hypothetical protein